MSLISLLTATEKQVHLGRLHMRPIQWHLKNNWRVPESLEKIIPIPKSLHPHLKWWLEEDNVVTGQPLHPLEHALQIFTDSSKEGWGAHLNEHVQGSRLRRPSILNTRYFRFGRKFRLSVRPSGRDSYEGNISALEANFGGRKRRYASNIYNTENKLYIFKLNGFERFPGKLFRSTIVKRDISYTSISTQNVIYRKKA